MNQVCFRLTVKTNSVGQFRLSLPTGEFSVQVDQGTLFELIFAANYLDIKVGYNFYPS